MSLDPALEPPGAPWYRCFWPWFILGLLSTAVAASLTTVVIAVSGTDSLVQDDYYRDGLAINRRLGREAAARELGIRAELHFDPVTGELQLHLRGEQTASVEALELRLSHPTRSDRDTEIALRRGADRVFRGSVDEPLSGRWYAALAPGLEASGSSQDWRISQAIAFASEAPILLGSGP